jgi:hypothetical protein
LLDTLGSLKRTPRDACSMMCCERSKSEKMWLCNRSLAT